MRIGFGYDIHRFAEWRKLILGGVEIAADRGLLGHSDADCLTHALADAILGALGLPDIGHFFPPTDPQWKDMDSQDILARAIAEARERGYRLGNADMTLVAEKPRIAPHIGAMKDRLASTLGAEPSQLGIKATTNEGIGGIGAGDGIAAYAVVLLQPTG